MVVERSLSLSAVLLSAGIAQADPLALVLASRCTPAGTSVEEVMRVLSAELAPVQVALVESHEPAADDSRIAVVIDECADLPASARATVWLRGRSSERSIVLGDAAYDARSRTLALAVAEMIREDPAFEPAPTNEVVAPPKPSSKAPSSAPPTDDSPSPSAPHERSAAAAALVPRASALIRLVVSAPVTLLAGGDVGVVGRRFGASLTALATQRDTSLGTARLFVIAASVSGEALRFGDHAALRAGGEVGTAFAGGTARHGASEQSGVALHGALGGGWWTGVPTGAGWVLEGYAGAGYASSLTARVDHRDTLTSNGVFVNAALGARFP
jgi:hypothetical protein